MPRKNRNARTGKRRYKRKTWRELADIASLTPREKIRMKRYIEAKENE